MRRWSAVLGSQPVVDRNHIESGIRGNSCCYDLVTIQRAEHEAATVKVQHGTDRYPARLSTIPIKPQPDQMPGARPKHSVFGYHIGWQRRRECSRIAIVNRALFARRQ